MRQKRPSVVSYDLEGVLIKCTFKVRKTITLKVDKGEVTLLAPRHISWDFLEDFLRSKKEWLFKTLAKQQEKMANVPSFMFLDDDKLYYLGELYSFQKVYDRKDVAFHNRVFYIPSSSLERAKILLQKFYQKQGEIYLKERVAYYEEKMNIAPKAIRVFNLRGNWGSCTSQKNINFHYKLMMMPPSIIDYVVVHEMCHLVHMNHSKDFWGLVECFYPDYKKCRTWLRENGYKFVL